MTELAGPHRPVTENSRWTSLTLDPSRPVIRRRWLRGLPEPLREGQDRSDSPDGLDRRETVALMFHGDTEGAELGRDPVQIGPDRRSRRPLFPHLPAACRRCDESELLTAPSREVKRPPADVLQPEVGVIADVLRDIRDADGDAGEAMQCYCRLLFWPDSHGW